MSWSNNPNPNQGSSYDQNLLFGAPRAPAQLWEGYDVGLLEGGRRSQHVEGPASPATSAPPAAPPPPLHQGPQLFAAAEKSTEEQFVAYASKSRTGFWHNRKGTIIVLFIVVVIAAVVGGIVGGTLGDPGIHSTSQSSPPNETTSDNLTSTMTMEPTMAVATGASNPGVPIAPSPTTQYRQRSVMPGLCYGRVMVTL